jgi:hypothetical protein
MFSHGLEYKAQDSGFVRCDLLTVFSHGLEEDRTLVSWISITIYNNICSYKKKQITRMSMVHMFIWAS